MVVVHLQILNMRTIDLILIHSNHNTHNIIYFVHVVAKGVELVAVVLAVAMAMVAHWGGEEGAHAHHHHHHQVEDLVEIPP